MSELVALIGRTVVILAAWLCINVLIGGELFR